MVELPSGTVTFLFTDIEGSTRLPKLVSARLGNVPYHRLWFTRLGQLWVR
jgi:class 3 adenylate cyclase